MIDLHCHMLPGIDDGPKNMEQSLAMARYAVDHGIERCVLTPHIQPGWYDNDYKIIAAVYENFKAELSREGIPLQIGMAAEVRVCGELPIMISQNKIPFLGEWQGKRVILLEFPHENVPVGVDKLVDWLIAKDILPLIAHPERNQAIMKQPNKIDQFLDKGCLLQLTADSITGLFGDESQKCALRYIKQDVAFIIASDAHNLHKRKPNLQEAKDFLLSITSAEQINKLMVDNPAQLISGVH